MPLPYQILPRTIPLSLLIIAVTTWQQQGMTHSVSGSVSAVPSDNQSHYLNSHFEPIRDENLFWRCDQNWDLPLVISPNTTVTYQLENGSRCTFSVLSHLNLFHLIENTSMVVETHLEYFFKDVGPLRDPLPTARPNNFTHQCQRKLPQQCHCVSYIIFLNSADFNVGLFTPSS